MGAHNLPAALNALKNRYSRGRVLSFQEVIDRIINGEYVYWTKPEHPKWMIHMSVAQIVLACRGGNICEAVPNEDAHE